MKKRYVRYVMRRLRGYLCTHLSALQLRQRIKRVEKRIRSGLVAADQNELHALKKTRAFLFFPAPFLEVGRRTQTRVSTSTSTINLAHRPHGRLVEVAYLLGGLKLQVRADGLGERVKSVESPWEPFNSAGLRELPSF